MRTFSFRAQAALDLRIQQDDRAQQAVAAAETRRNSAETARGLATAAVADAVQRANVDVSSRPADVTLRTWYRNWIVLQRQVLARRERELEAREQEVREARRVAIETHRKRRALEKFKERRRHAHDVAARHEEGQLLDELGSLQFARRSRGGTS